ncbi:MAG: hypothetical protein U5K75_08575 [Ahrensia sp.]|nr:hypothetical protein [Ahrensia sp.]
MQYTPFKRVLELAYDRQLIAQELNIDQLLFRVSVKSPLVLARQAQGFERTVQWLQMVMATAAGLPMQPIRQSCGKG